MCDAFVWWATHAPLWQLYLAMALSLLLLILIVSSSKLGAMMKRNHRHATFRVCEHCGRRPRGNGKSRFCSEKCERRHYSNQVRQNFAGRKWHKNRLFSQTNLCGICSQPILSMKEATIDHIMPLSKGGQDTIENMQLAHYDCNQLKADSVMPGDIIEPSEVVYG